MKKKERSETNKIYLSVPGRLAKGRPMRTYKKRDMTKYTIVRQVLVEEIYEVVAESSLEALTLAKAGEGLNESFIVDPGSFRIEGLSPGFYRVKKV